MTAAPTCLVAADKYDDLLASALRASEAVGANDPIVRAYATSLRCVETAQTAAAKDGCVVRAFASSASNLQLDDVARECPAGSPPIDIDAVRRCRAKYCFDRVKAKLDIALAP